MYFVLCGEPDETGTQREMPKVTCGHVYISFEILHTIFSDYYPFEKVKHNQFLFLLIMFVFTYDVVLKFL